MQTGLTGKSGRGVSRLASIGRRGSHSPPWHVRTTREVDPSREGQLDTVGVFNLCRARPRQMIMGHVVSPLLPSWLALVLNGLLWPSSFRPGHWAPASRATRRGTPPTLLRSRDGSMSPGCSRCFWSRATRRARPLGNLQFIDIFKRLQAYVCGLQPCALAPSVQAGTHAVHTILPRTGVNFCHSAWCTQEVETRRLVVQL